MGSQAVGEGSADAVVVDDGATFMFEPVTSNDAFTFRMSKVTNTRNMADCGLDISTSPVVDLGSLTVHRVSIRHSGTAQISFTYRSEIVKNHGGIYSGEEFDNESEDLTNLRRLRR